MDNKQQYSELNSLLTKISLIKNKNNDIKKATGKNYNIFRILGLGTEELIFSKIIANLLKVNSSHGMGTKFLELFIKRFSTSLDTPFDYNLDYSKAKVFTEYDIGPKSKHKGENSTGGRLDILIEIPSNQGSIGFIIENKIYAEDQPCQLRRYKNFADNKYKKEDYYLLYLTLNGRSPSKESTLVKECKDEEEKTKQQFWYEISYKYFIKEWLEECIKESSNYPYLRETLNQFLDQIKKLTGQDYNKMAEKEIINELCNNLSGAETIADNYEYAKYVCALSNINKFLEECKKEGFVTGIPKIDIENKETVVNKLGKREFAFRIYKNNWNFFIRFAFQDKSLHMLKYGIGFDYDKKPENDLSHDKIKLDYLRSVLDMEGADYTNYWLYRKYEKGKFGNWTAEVIKGKDNPDLVEYLHNIKNEILKQIEKLEESYPELFTSPQDK